MTYFWFALFLFTLLALFSSVWAVKQLQGQLEQIAAGKSTELTTSHPLMKDLVQKIQRLLLQKKAEVNPSTAAEAVPSEIYSVLKNLHQQMTTPLSVASGYTEVLRSIITNPDHVNMLKKIDLNLMKVGESADLQGEYQLILEKEAGQQPEMLDLSRLFTDFWQVTATELAADGVSSSVTAAENLKIWADKEVLKRLFFYLLTNIKRYEIEQLNAVLQEQSGQPVMLLTGQLQETQTAALQRLGKIFAKPDQTSLEQGIAARLLQLLGAQAVYQSEQRSFSLRISFFAPASVPEGGDQQ